MYKCGAENFEANSTDSGVKGGCGAERIHSQLTAEDFRRILPPKVTPEACVRADDGYIACGPIVGYERPGESIFAKAVKIDADAKKISSQDKSVAVEDKKGH